MNRFTSKEMFAEIKRRNALVADGKCGNCSKAISHCTNSPCERPEHEVVSGVLMTSGDTLDWFQQKCLRTTTRHLSASERVRRSGNTVLSALMGNARRDLDLSGAVAIADFVDQQMTRDDLSCAGLGIVGEAGEVADIVKKAQFHGHGLSDVTKTKIKLELGDVMWYVSEIASIIGVRLSDVARSNIEKLEARYKDGFSSASSIKRSDG